MLRLLGCSRLSDTALNRACEIAAKRNYKHPHIQLISHEIFSNCRRRVLQSARLQMPGRASGILDLGQLRSASGALGCCCVWQGPYGISSQGLEQVMDYKTVMVGLALDRPNDACLRVAGDIAERFGARIIGVAASDLRPPMYFADGDFAQKLLDQEAAAIEQTAIGTRSGVSRFGREARNGGGVAFRPVVAGALHAAAGESRRYPGDRRPLGDPGRSHARLRTRAIW